MEDTMFRDRMNTPAIPERVYALCKIVEKKPISVSNLREKMEPEFLENTTSYFPDYKNAAEELGLIDQSDNTVSLAVAPDKIKNIYSMRRYVNIILDEFKDGQFYQVTKAYFSMNQNALTVDKNVANLGPMFNQLTGRTNIDAPAMRAWRFWASFLGFGYLQDMYLIPNADIFLEDIISLSDFIKDKWYSFDEFMGKIMPYCGIIMDTNASDKKINFGMSNGLRSLHDAGKIKLEHILDQEDIWSLYPLKAHPISATVTNIKICR